MNEPIQEFRIKTVADGHSVAALDKTIEMPQETKYHGACAAFKRGEWASGLNLKILPKKKWKLSIMLAARPAFIQKCGSWRREQPGSCKKRELIW